MNIINEKRCTKCGKVKPINEFHKKTGTKDNHQFRCKTCLNEENREYKKIYNPLHREQSNQYFKEYRKNHKEKINFFSRIFNANKKGAEGSFSLVQWKTLCNFYGNKCLRCGNSVELCMDHVIPISYGGLTEISNMQPLCHSCNGWKGNKTIDYRFDKGEFARLIQQHSV